MICDRVHARVRVGGSTTSIVRPATANDMSSAQIDGQKREDGTTTALGHCFRWKAATREATVGERVCMIRQRDRRQRRVHVTPLQFLQPTTSLTFHASVFPCLASWYGSPRRNLFRHESTEIVFLDKARKCCSVAEISCPLSRCFPFLLRISP